MALYDYLYGPDAMIQNVFAWHAGNVPEKTWCVFNDKPHSYGEINAASNQLAHALRDKAGVRKGDAVAVFMLNCPEYFPAMFAIHRLGAIYVPCSTYYKANELHYQINHSEAKAIIVDDALLPLVQEVRADCPGLAAVILNSETRKGGTELLSEFIDGQPNTMPAESAAVTADDLAMIMYTSGTTDRPKGVMFSQGNLTAAADMAVKMFRWTPDDRYLHYFPLFHANGGLYGVFPAILAQATICMIPKFSASAYGEQLRKYDISFCPMNSTNVKMVLNNPETRYDRQHRAWRMMQGLSLVPEHIIEFERRFNTRLIATYGLTESLGISVADDAIGPRHIGSSGRPQRGYTIRVVDDEGNDVPIGEPGEILVHNEHKYGVALGYYKDPEKTRETFRDGWVHSGDVVYMDKEGYVWFVERKKDMIKRSGFNVAAAEVERAIQMVPGVKECAVVATPDAVREEAIVAFIVADAGASVTEQAVMETCKRELAEYKIPQFIEFLDAMPLNFLGKLERKALRERALKFRIDSYERTPLGSRQRD